MQLGHLESVPACLVSTSHVAECCGLSRKWPRGPTGAEMDPLATNLEIMAQVTAIEDETSAAAGPDGRMVVYFRPAIGDPWRWLSAR